MRNEFDFDSFKKEWRSANDKAKVDMLSQISELSPSQGILPVLAGIDSYHFPVRNRAKEILVALKLKVFELNNNPADKSTLLDAIKESSVFSARIHNKLTSDLSVPEIKYYLEILLESGGRGPFYAWKFCQSKFISIYMLKNIIDNISETGRLALVDQYLGSSPLVRRKFGIEFRRLLKGITARKVVIKFYASLFDMKREADPFLNNISLRLRDPATIISKELKSSDLNEKADALKALSMIAGKIDPRLLADLLKNKADPLLRKTILTIVENSSIGTYSELADPIFEIVCNSSDEEAIAAFRALVISSSSPLYQQIDRIRENALWLMPQILDELSLFSRVSLLFIQELVNNRSVYLDTNRDIYKALVLGMIKKRPERILEILNSFDDLSHDGIRMSLLTLSRKIEQLMSMETKEISSGLKQLIHSPGVEYKKKEEKGFFEGIFSKSLDKKIKEVKQGRVDEIDFNHEIIENVDFSSELFYLSLNFNECTIKDSDFSFSSFVDAGFKKCLFNNVNFNGTKFDSISFDNAVFIDVSAEESEFVNCSFHKALFFHTDFNRAVMVDAIFTDSVISDSSFAMTDLSGATFAGADISAVSFVESTLFQTDFTGIRARFCRFPSHSYSKIESEYAEFNARSFKINESDLPDNIFYESSFEKQISSEFDLLFLTEFMRFGKKQFLRQNKFSLLIAFDLFKPKQADLFEVVPVLIHGNINFSGFNADDENAPCGISGYLPSKEAGLTAAKYLNKDELIFRKNDSSYVEALFTIGSTGSIAQSSDSDIDYWVCIRDNTHDILKRNFQHKLSLLEKWAFDMFQTEIHFFIVDVNKANQDEFGDSSLESSGSAQGRILKEEFYRTMIHVAGKLPFWCTLPASVTRNYYERLHCLVCKVPARCRYIDLGDIYDIPAGEYFGASIWQMFKLLKSPFKSVIKMALLDNFIHETGKENLLCNRIKDEWINSGFQFNLDKTDSYYVLLNSLVNYYKLCDDPEAVRLVQLCFFLKAGISKKSDLENTLFGFRKDFINHCMKKWNWNEKQMFDAGRFKDWEYGRVTRLSSTIEKYMIKIYKKVNHVFDAGDEKKALITPEDRTALGRKMFVQFSKQPGKIEKNLLISSSDKYFQRLSLNYVKKTGQKSFWELVQKPPKFSMEKEETLKRARTIEEIGAWFVHNGFYSENTIINLVPNPTAVTVDEINALFKHLHTFFLKDDQNIIFDALNLKEQITSLFVSLNLSTPRNIKQIIECSAVYRNSWGEMYCVFFSKQDGFNSMDDFVKRLKKELHLKKKLHSKKELYIDELPVNTLFYFPKSLSLKFGNDFAGSGLRY